MRNLPWFENDTLVNLYQNYGFDKKLRVIVSEKLSDRLNSEGKEEPWYLITNDFTSEKEAIIARYYFRFEIEETFKDLKHINDLSTFYRIKKEQTFKILLWFSILTIWLSFRYHTECCVMAHSRKALKLGLDWVERLLTAHRYTTFGMASL